MILIFGGTTEGRVAVDVIDSAGKPYFYSTHGNGQVITCKHGTHVVGGMDAEAISKFCTENGVKLIVDAAHPFATLLHSNIFEASKCCGLEVIRLERVYPLRDKRIIWCKDYSDAVEQLKRNSVECLLALTGVKTIDKLRDFWTENECWFRILKRDESERILAETGFPKEKSLYYENDGEIIGLLSQIKPDAIILKESGESGGFAEKSEVALNHGIKVFAVERPVLPSKFHTVNGRHTLRREVERLLPGFFELRSGVTTGTCATAAAKVALATLLYDEKFEDVAVTLPDGETLRLPVEFTRIEDSGGVTVGVRKDAGDDPDVTHLSVITVNVTKSDNHGIRFIGGEGVGTVTLPGLGIEVGGPAINPVPRLMIENELRQLYDGGLNVTISVPGGEELAKKTFNTRVGVVNGISIIGTSGIVQPFSNEAFVEAIRREFEVAVATGSERVVLNSGARSETVVKSRFTDLPAQAFIHYGNAIGESLAIADEMGVRALTIGLMIGKAVKLAEGNLDTHSHKVLMNIEFIVKMASDAGCSHQALEKIRNIKMARELWTLFDANDASLFFPELLRRCSVHCRAMLSADCRLELLLISDDGKIEYEI